MCTLCDHNVPANQLVSDAYANLSKSLVATDQVMSVYLHAEGSAIQVDYGQRGGLQTNETFAIPSDDQAHLASFFDQLEEHIDLEFEVVDSPDEADLSIYYQSEIFDENGKGNVLGLAKPSTSGWDVFINTPKMNSDGQLEWVLAHEIGHALGLEHPFDDTDGDLYGDSTDPNSSASVDQTVMAYRRPESGVWPDFFTESDLEALADIWGEASPQPVDLADYVVGSSGDDIIETGFGNDYLDGGFGNDALYGNQDEDTLIGGWGQDQLYGGKGADQLFGNQGQDLILGNKGNDAIYGGKDNDWLYGNQGDDIIYGNKGDDAIWAGQDNDWIDGGEGNDWLFGNKGADVFHLSAGNDVIGDFSYGEGDSLDVNGIQGLGYQQLDTGLLVTYDQGSTLLANVTVG